MIDKENLFRLIKLYGAFEAQAAYYNAFLNRLDDTADLDIIKHFETHRQEALSDSYRVFNLIEEVFV